MFYLVFLEARAPEMRKIMSGYIGLSKVSFIGLNRIRFL